VDNERKLDCYMRSLWNDHDQMIPYAVAFEELRKPMPYFDDNGIRLPDVYDDERGVDGIDRYRASLAHMAAHRRWSQKMIVDNWSPFQRIAVETFEDSRVEYLAMQRYPGLRKLFIALHPIPEEADLQLQDVSLINLRLAMVSRAILDPDYQYENADIREFVDRFFAEMEQGESCSANMASLALSFIARTRRQADASSHTHFENTEVDYRDDNRHLWIFIENSDEEE